MRLFIALPLEAEVERKLGNIINDLRGQDGKIKWVNAKNIHLTLKFLGDTNPNEVDSIKTELQRLAKPYSKFTGNIIKLGAFPNLNRPRVIWAGMDSVPEKMISLAKEIDQAMHTLGWDLEARPFKPHFTLGRVKDSRGLEQLTDYMKQYRFEPIPFCFDKLVLFQSTLTPRGPIYKSLLDISL